MKILVSSEDDFLYDRILELLNQVKLVQGGTALASTLRRHSTIKAYMITKQAEKLGHIEDTYFDKSGLNNLAVENYHHKNSLQVH